MKLWLGLFVLFAFPGVASAACGSDLGAASKTIRKAIAGIEGNVEGTCIFYGDYSGDGRDDVLLFAYYLGLEGGNMIMLDILKFRSAKAGFKQDGKVENVFGENPRDVRFSKGRIRLTTTTLGPDEPRCCPTVAKRWTIPTG